MEFRRLILAALLIASTPLLIAQGTYTQLSFPGASETAPVGVTKSGDVSGFYTDSSGNFHGFLFSGGTYTAINYPGAQWTMPAGMNDLGQIVGTTFNPTLAFVYDPSTQSFTEIAYPGVQFTYPNSINDQGVIGGSFANSDEPGMGFELDGSTYTEINPPGSLLSSVIRVTESGELIGEYWTSLPGTEDYFTFNEGVYKQISVPGIHNFAILGANPSGTALVGQQQISARLTVGFLYQNGTLTKIQYPGSHRVAATSMSSTGEVVGNFTSESGQFIYGFTWTPPAAELSK